MQQLREGGGRLGAGDPALAVEDEPGGRVNRVGSENPAIARVPFRWSGAGLSEVVPPERSGSSLLRGLAKAGKHERILYAAGKKFGVSVGELQR